MYSMPMGHSIHPFIIVVILHYIVFKYNLGFFFKLMIIYSLRRITGYWFPVSDVISEFLITVPGSDSPHDFVKATH